MNRALIAVIFAAIVLVSLAVATSDDPNVVQTKYGAVRGAQDLLTGVRVWRGVPFAAPPVGDKRLRVPTTPQPWSGVLDCQFDRNICPQFKLAKNLHLGNEDCLYLAVYKPANPKRKGPLPVMFWIYGGAWVLGDYNEFGMYDAKNFALSHDVIVVAPNYRLGALGFMALDELKRESGDLATTGNYALLDQRLAMEWVRDNIAAFGGDPNQVVIAGESAGAFSVCFHVASKASSGLFKGAIMQSGSCDTSYFWVPYNNSVSWSNIYSKLVGCDPAKLGTGADLVSCLRKLSTDQILGIDAATKSVESFNELRRDLEQLVLAEGGQLSDLEDEYEVDPEAERMLGLSTNPRLAAAVAALTRVKKLIRKAESENRSEILGDDYVPTLFPLMDWGASLDGSRVALSDTPFATIARGEHNRVPVILGTNHDEGTIFLFAMPFITGQSVPLNEDSFKKTVQHLFKYMHNDTAVQMILDQYPSKNYVSQDDRAAKMLRDFFFTCPTRRTARALAAHPPDQGQAVYLYQYNYRAFIDGWILGAYHASEIVLVFGNEWPIIVHAFSETDRKVSVGLGAYWSNFVASLDPNVGFSAPIRWPAYNFSAEVNLDINKDFTLNAHLLQSTCDFWDKIIYPHGVHAPQAPFHAYPSLGASGPTKIRVPAEAFDQIHALQRLLEGKALSDEDRKVLSPFIATLNAHA